MTSTSTFQGLADKPNSSSRVLKPPGGGSSNIFGVPDDVSSTKPHKMASNIFGPPEEMTLPKRSNPPGGKSSGIFSEAEPIPSQSPAVSVDQKSSDHLREPVAPVAVRVHPNKPKDANIFCTDADEELKDEEHEKQECEEKKEEEKPKEPTVDDHEPHLGPRPRSHNKVTQPPGGRSTLSLF